MARLLGGRTGGSRGPPGSVWPCAGKRCAMRARCGAPGARTCLRRMPGAEDQRKGLEEAVQKLTDEYVKEVGVLGGCCWAGCWAAAAGLGAGRLLLGWVLGACCWHGCWAAAAGLQ